MLMSAEATSSQTDGWALPFPETDTIPTQPPTSERKEGNSSFQCVELKELTMSPSEGE